MRSLIFALGTLLIVLAGLALMLGCSKQARLLGRAVLGLVIGMALIPPLAGALGGELRTLPLGLSEVLGLLGLGALALLGWLARRRRLSEQRVAPRLVRRERTLPPPRFDTEERP